MCQISPLGSLQASVPWLTPDPASVRVRLLWDVLSPDPNSCPPLYVLWRTHSQIPQRVVWPGPVPASLNLALLESVLRHVGLNEVHKAVGLLLETLGTPPTGLHLQRYDFLGGVQLVLCLALSPILTCLLPPH